MTLDKKETQPRYLAELVLLRAAVKRDGDPNGIRAFANVASLLEAFLTRYAEDIKRGDTDPAHHPQSYCEACKQNDGRLCAGHLAHFVRFGTNGCVGPTGPGQ